MRRTLTALAVMLLASSMTVGPAAATGGSGFTHRPNEVIYVPRSGMMGGVNYASCDGIYITFEDQGSRWATARQGDYRMGSGFWDAPRVKAQVLALELYRPGGAGDTERYDYSAKRGPHASSKTHTCITYGFMSDGPQRGGAGTGTVTIHFPQGLPGAWDMPFQGCNYPGLPGC